MKNSLENSAELKEKCPFSLSFKTHQWAFCVHKTHISIKYFVDGSERWGTIKNERYKKSELRQDDLFDKVKYTGWLVNNDNHRFHYDKERRLFSELKYGKAIGEYSFAAFDELVKDKGMFGEFAPHDFK